VQLITRQLGPGFIQQMQTTCRTCNGKGSALKPEDRCSNCNGEQVVKEKKLFEIAIEKGMRRGDNVTFRGEGDQIPGVRLSGDIIIILDQKPHPVFTRKGNHLYMEKTISLAEALTGFTLVVDHLDGRQLAISPPKHTCVDPAHLWAVNREGMPVPKTGGVERGNLVIKFNVLFPQTLKDKEALTLRSVLTMPEQPHPHKDAEHVVLMQTTVDLKEAERQGQREEDDDEPRGARTATCAQQ
jgi:DnaJ family protein A protein 2